MLNKANYARSFSSGLEVLGIEVVVIIHALTGIAANEKNMTDMFFLPGKGHFIDGLQLFLGEMDFDSLVAVLKLLLDN